MFYSSEKKAILSLACLYVFRILGLFMLISTLPLYAKTLPLSDPRLIGLAIGIYGFMQGILQIPFGILSDRFGRRRLLNIGLCFFLLGSLIGSFATSIYTIILARALQGTSAIGCVILASLADLTREEIRARAMGLIGISIGGAFVLALILGPMIAEKVGLKGIFWVCFLLSIFALWLVNSNKNVLVNLPNCSVTRNPLAGFALVLFDRKLIFLNFGIFILHAILASLFLVIPSILMAEGFEQTNLNKIYAEIILGSLLVVFPMLSIAERFGKKDWLFINAIGVLWLALFLAVNQSFSLVFSMGLFFVGFNILEALLPSLVSSTTKQYKGTALSIYSSMQFFGIFVGAALGGWLNHRYGEVAVLSFSVILAGTWFLWALTEIGVQSYVKRRE